MIRLLFDNSKATGSPRVFRDGVELECVQSVTIQPFRLCRVVVIDLPFRYDNHGVATSGIEDEYEVALESAS
jgi:hypothetical protein